MTLEVKKIKRMRESLEKNKTNMDVLRNIMVGYEIEILTAGLLNSQVFWVVVW